MNLPRTNCVKPVWATTPHPILPVLTNRSFLPEKKKKSSLSILVSDALVSLCAFESTALCLLSPAPHLTTTASQK